MGDSAAGAAGSGSSGSSSSSGGRGRGGRAAAAAALLLLLCLLSAGAVDDHRPKLKRMDAKKWKRVVEVARAKARSAARQYLEDSSSELVVPLEIDVILVGLDGDGGYGHKLDSSYLSSLLSTHLQWYCPYSWETEEELGVCMHVNFQVLSSADDPTISTLLRKVEAHLRSNMRQTHAAYDDRLAGGQRKFFTVEASGMEPVFNEFMGYLYQGEDGYDDERDAAAAEQAAASAGVGYTQGGGGRRHADVWHRHNAIFVINPSKVRVNPEGNATDHVPPKLAELFVWDSVPPAAKDKQSTPSLDAEEAGFIYRYAYNGVGEAASWLSSRNYLVVDLAAGPTTYGPLVSQGGAVTPQGMPSLRDTYAHLLDQLSAVPNQHTAQEHALQSAEVGQTTLLAGRLAATLAAASKAAFIPDVASQHIEHAKTVLVPITVLSDFPAPADGSIQTSNDNYWGVNVTHVEISLSQLLAEGQDAVVITTHHELHGHPQLAAALHKATRSHSEAVVDIPEGRDYSGADMGIHTHTFTFIDPDVLMEEIGHAADFLTHGLVSVAHAGNKVALHHIEQLRHDGTRVIPVFVLALQNHPDDVVLANRELVTADHDAVMVLQLRQGTKWGTADEFFTGHMANGRRVVLDGSASTRHVVAGLAQALAGVVPAHRHFEPALGRLENDWRWAVGATPFGPYSNFSGVSEIMQNAARRNQLLAHVSAALRQLQHQLDAVDAFVQHHFQGPWEAAGLKDAHRHWLDTVASTRHGYNTTLGADVVYEMESGLAEIRTMVEQLAMDMFTHDFAAADATVSDKLLPAVAKLCTALDNHLDAAEEVMQCCHLANTGLVSQAFLLLAAFAGAAAVFFSLVGVALCARMARRKATKVVGLPTYGLPMWSSGRAQWVDSL